MSFPRFRQWATAHGKKQGAGATHYPGERSLQTPGEWVAHRPTGATGRKRGQGQKQQCHWEAPKRKRGSPTGICTRLEPCSVTTGGMAFSGNLAILDSLQGAEIHAGLLCQGRARNKAGCCQPPHRMRPWQEVGLLSNLDRRQVSSKHALSMACVWHCSARSTHTPWSAKLPATHPAYQSTLTNTVPPRLAALPMRSGISQQQAVSCTNSREQGDPNCPSALPASYKETGKKSCNTMLQFPHKEQYFSTSHIFSEC